MCETLCVCVFAPHLLFLCAQHSFITSVCVQPSMRLVYCVSQPALSVCTQCVFTRSLSLSCSTFLHSPHVRITPYMAAVLCVFAVCICTAPFCNRPRPPSSPQQYAQHRIFLATLTGEQALSWILHVAYVQNLANTLQNPAKWDAVMCDSVTIVSTETSTWKMTMGA